MRSRDRVVVGERVTLRRVRLSDLPRLYVRYKDPEVLGPYMNGGRVGRWRLLVIYAKGRLWAPPSHGTLLIVYQQHVVGEVAFTKSSALYTTVEVSYLLYDPRYGARGLMSEATGLLVQFLFTKHNVRRLEARIHPCNHSSRRLVQGLGFHLEAVSRRLLQVADGSQDAEVFVLFPDD